MAPPNPLHQNAVFYTPPWHERYDRLFISSLVHEMKCGRYRVGKRNPGAVQAAMTEVNHIFGTNFDFKFCLRRFHHLGIRYRLFRWITRLSAVNYDPITHHVDCSPDGWEWICEKEPLARAYILRGETQYDALKLLFQEDDDYPELYYVQSETVIDLTTDDDDMGVETSPMPGAVSSQSTEKGKRRSEAAQVMEGKQASVAGFLEVPDNSWWEDVAEDDWYESTDGEDIELGNAPTSPMEEAARKACAMSDEEEPEEDPDEDPEEAKTCEVGEDTPDTKHSSTEPVKKRDPTVEPTVRGRRLFKDESSSASFSPSKPKQ